MEKIKNMLHGHKDEHAHPAGTGTTAAPGYNATSTTVAPGNEQGTTGHHEKKGFLGMGGHKEGDDGKKGGGLLSKLKPGGGSSSSSSSSSDEEKEGARERNILRRQRRAERQQSKAGLGGTAGTTEVAPGMTGTTAAPVGHEKKHGFF